MGTILDFAEANAKVNADFHIAMADGLQKESNVLLSLVVAGASGLAAFGVSLAGRSPPAEIWQMWATFAGAAWLFIVSILVLRQCLWIGPLYAPANEPKNIPIDETHPLDNVRAGELVARQECIRRNIERNDRTAWWLNLCRALAAATPVFSGLVGLAVWVACRAC